MDNNFGIPVNRLVDGTVTVAPTGEIDFSRVGSLRDALVQAATLSGTRQVVVDLRGVTLIDSTGFGALISGLRVATDNGLAYQVRNANPFIYQCLVTTGPGDHPQPRACRARRGPISISRQPHSDAVEEPTLSSVQSST
jgi:anti-sigma B factor antagonist